MQDILNRQPFIDKVIRIIELLANSNNGGSFAIDGIWGSGKTFVVNMLEEYLRTIQNEESADDRYYVFHYNCWEYDYYEEPSIAMISMLLSSTRKKVQLLGTAAWRSAFEIIKEIADTFVNNKIGIKPLEAIGNKNDMGDSGQEKGFDSYFGFNDAIDKARASIGKIAKQKPIIIIVDELDRCNPQYAMKVLERLHHLFIDQNNVVLIIAVDGNQLEKAVKEIYGYETDVEKYLRRFIDFQIHLDVGTIQSEFENKYSDYFESISFSDSKQKKETIDIIREIFDCSGIDIRNQEKIIEKAKTINSFVNEYPIGAKEAVFETLLLSCMFFNEKLKNNSDTRISDLYYSYGWLVHLPSRKRDLQLPAQFEEYLEKLVQTNTSKGSSDYGIWYAASSNLIGRVLYIFDNIYNNGKQHFSEETLFSEMLYTINNCRTIGELALMIT